MNACAIYLCVTRGHVFLYYFPQRKNPPLIPFPQHFFLFLNMIFVIFVDYCFSIKCAHIHIWAYEWLDYHEMHLRIDHMVDKRRNDESISYQWCVKWSTVKCVVLHIKTHTNQRKYLSLYSMLYSLITWTFSSFDMISTRFLILIEMHLHFLQLILITFYPLIEYFTFNVILIDSDVNIIWHHFMCWLHHFNANKRFEC